MSGVWFSVLVVLEFLVHDCGRTFGASSGNQSSILPDYEVDAINKLLISTKQPWDNEYKDFSASDCGRRGVDCDDNSNTSHITNIDFSNHGLSGQIPEEIGNLSSLKYLNLKGNKLNGHIPDSFSKLLNLTNLYLYGNLLEGPIQVIAKLTSLTDLDVARAEAAEIEPGMRCTAVHDFKYGSASVFEWGRRRRILGTPVRAVGRSRAQKRKRSCVMTAFI